MNKASGGDGIPAELFPILKDKAVKVFHSIWQQIWKTQQWPQDRKKSVFIPILKKVRERLEREVGGGNGMGKTCKLKAVSFQCMPKFTTN